MTVLLTAAVLLAHLLAPVAPTAPLVAGGASWYGTGPGAGEAAAGPGLRRALGVHWRGQHVRVCRAGTTRCVRVRLSDWCSCPARGRQVDLSDEDFRTLTRTALRPRGNLRLGVVAVAIYPVRFT